MIINQNYLQREKMTMAQIGHVLEILDVKQYLEQLKSKGFIKDWELPYENLLTRLSAAIFFITPVSEEKIVEINEQMARFDNYVLDTNTDQLLSDLPYRIQFKQVDELTLNKW